LTLRLRLHEILHFALGFAGVRVMQSALQTAPLTVRSSRSLHRHALPPVLLGLLASMLLLLLIDPRALVGASLIAHAYMIAIFVLASAAYLFSLFEAGEVTGAEVDHAHAIVTIERTGLFARSIQKIPFADISTVRMDTRYDNDGYPTSVPVLVLTSHELLPLPTGTTESDIANMRAMLRPSPAQPGQAPLDNAYPGDPQ